MGRASSRKALLRASKETLRPDEGKLFVSFVFGGKIFTRTHQSTASELKHMRDLCKEYGDEAADQLIWKVHVKGARDFAAAVVAEAALEYIRKNHKPKVVVENPLPPGVSEVLHPQQEP